MRKAILESFEFSIKTYIPTPEDIDESVLVNFIAEIVMLSENLEVCNG